MSLMTTTKKYLIRTAKMSLITTTEESLITTAKVWGFY